MEATSMKKQIYLYFFLLFFFFNCIALSGLATHSIEASVLLAIKSSLVDPSEALKDWKTPVAGSQHCHWTGVLCNPAGLVESLDLSGLNLSGNISGDSIGQISGLLHLNLSSNLFSSTLPKTISNLPLLKEFDVSNNEFVGEFPSGLGASAELRALNASGNNFSGKLPEDIGNATSLESLDFRGSYFEGTIPASYKSLQKLKFLGLSGNNLTGKLPAEMGQLSSLETLIIGYNEFTGLIPAELANLTSLRYLDMAVGSLSGPIPPSLGKLVHLDTIYLFNNELEGEIPKELGNLSSLTFLDLSDNRLTGRIPDELTQLDNLQLLNLMSNRLVGPIPAGLANLTQLAVLEIWNNSLTGSLPGDLGQNSPLQWLDVSSNALTGEIPSGLCRNGNLTKLILFNNAFSGSIPATLTRCSPLVRVRMHNNLLNGSIPSGFGKLPSLQRLELAGNNLSGSIPDDDIPSSRSLSFVDLSRNHLNLSLPPTILSIPSLQTFIASDNAFSGTFPDQFQECLALSTVDLSNNRLTGPIPTTLASCHRLVKLDLSGNNLTGEIPVAIASMPALSILDLSSNQLTGPIPPDFGNSRALETLNLSHNALYGPVPVNGVLKAINPEDLLGNPGLCGGVLPPCFGPFVTVDSQRQKIMHLRHAIAGWAIGTSAILAAFALFLASRWAYRRWYLEGRLCFSRDDDKGDWPWRLTAFQRLHFTSSDVLACIKEANVIGMGATGTVYRAEIPRHHTTVAVKKLLPRAPTPLDAEIKLLGRLRHRNIVRALGYLHNETETMIVYEYMPNGSLWETLHGGEGRRAGAGVAVDWVARYNIAVGVAAGLAYLHHDCCPPIIHRDVKSSNILLDAAMEARLADFGLARVMSAGKEEAVSGVAGSYGYIAPEYAYSLKVDQKSDIYSFGVVLMELVTGRKPVEAEFGEGRDIVGWVREKLRSNRGAEVLDAGVGGRCEHVQEELLLVLRIAVLCTARLPKDRPPMRDVLTMLGEAKPRRKSSSGGGGSAVVHKVVREKPVFTTAAEPDFV